jgi:hypothetical protein
MPLSPVKRARLALLTSIADEMWAMERDELGWWQSIAAMHDSAVKTPADMVLRQAGAIIACELERRELEAEREADA